MNTLTSLKLISAKRPSDVPPVVKRRNRLIAKIGEQTELAKGAQDGKAYAPLHTRTVKDRETGDVRRVEAPKRIKAVVHGGQWQSLPDREIWRQDFGTCEGQERN
jgi:hypothetical protein